MKKYILLLMSGLLLSNSLSASALSRTDWVKKAESLSEKNKKSLALQPSHAEKNLSGSDLSEADLIGAYLDDNTNFSKANMRGIQLIGAHLKYANFSKANLSEGNSYFAYCFGADFSGADLTNANLSNADLSEANFENANMKNTNLLGSHMNSKTNFREATNMSKEQKDYAQSKGASNVPK
ncbi:TPA: hypothetical protein DEO28_01075 [Candidatus Dependentiae bacterium]|nr:MAG: Pentapeptide repeat protein [candidate division TM6 bacterium GW2011_GWE2_31_21]KKP53771.1 MAG: Pentapeptide repeat protein [candidate division TM6 bacterium GW2011_GWF2_33_332]HBS48475.1 hypothetical protein [Candidatus Dependentiae bacterium]HBZ73090.1 hypothetical protein [Candidatus Dependentiae bacterium]